MRSAFFCFVVLFACFGACSRGTAAITNLTIEEAVRIALTNNPHLAEAYANMEATEARVASAGKLPNPEAIARMEAAPLSSRTTSEAEYIAGISQTIPLGRRLSAARRVEQAGFEVRQKELEAAALALRKSVHSAFATALFTFEVFKLQTNLGTNIQELLRITKVRVEAGDAAPLDLARLEAEAAQHRLEVKEATFLHREAMRALAAVLGDFKTPIQSLAGNLEDALEIEALREAALSIETHPVLAAMESAAEAQRARVRLAKAERIPDVNLDLFYRRLQGSRENSFDVGIRIPIPLFDNKRSRVREAESELRAAQARFEMTRNQIGVELQARKLSLEKALETVAVLKNAVVPKIESISRAAEARYTSGDTSLSEFLMVRRDASDYRLDYLEALRNLMESWAELQVYSR